MRTRRRTPETGPAPWALLSVLLRYPDPGVDGGTAVGHPEHRVEVELGYLR